jgi:hypothetical protein
VAITGAATVAVAVGSGSDAQITWIVQRGPAVAYITIPGHTIPPDLVSETVAGLMGDALNHEVSTERPPPVPTSSPASPQQSNDASVSSGSTVPGS